MKQLKENETLILDYDGVIVRLHLDYQRGLASFIKKDGQGQQYLFTKRTVDYLGGWVKVLRALEQATILADKLLREQEKVREDNKLTEVAELMLAVKDLEL